jgi:hypothetical protein
MQWTLSGLSYVYNLLRVDLAPEQVLRNMPA